MNSEIQKKRKLHSSPQLFNDSASDCSSSKDDFNFQHTRSSRVEVISESNPNIQCCSPFSAYPRFDRVLTPEPVSESSSNRLCSNPFSLYPRYNQVLKQELSSESISSRVCYSPLSLSNVVFVNTCDECDKTEMPSVDGNEESKPIISQLMAQLSCKEVSSNVIEVEFNQCETTSKSTSTTDLEVTSTSGTEESLDFWNNIVRKQDEAMSGSLLKLHQQNLEHMILANKLKIAFDLTSDENM